MIPAPWPHQTQGTQAVKDHAGYGLFFDMGCGKTRTAIDAIAALPPVDTLILCPKAVVDVWPDEFAKYAQILPTPIVALSGTVKEKADQVRAAPIPALFVCNYDSVWRDELAKAFMRRPPGTIIADEVHRIKSPTGKASKFICALAVRATKKIGLSGTPFPNSPMDAWAVMKFIDPTLFPMKFKEFRDIYAVMRPLHGQPFVRIISGYKNLAQMQAKIASRSMVVKADDVLQLPECVHQRLTVKLNPRTRKLYEALSKDLIAEVEQGTITAANALVLVARLQQATAGFGSVAVVKDGIESKEVVPVGTEKYDRLTEFLEDLDPNEKVVVFYRFSYSKHAIMRASTTTHRKAFELSGQANTLQAWKDSPAGSVVAIQQQAGGAGISTVEARHVMYYELSHNLGEHLQTLARSHRPGQTRKTFFWHLVAENTVDEEIYEALEKKQSVIDHIVKKAQNGLR